MIRFVILIFVLFVSTNSSLPICNVDYWVSMDPMNCTTTPNGTYTAMNYNGTCTLSPDNPHKSSYKLKIDFATKAVQTFTIYGDRSCRPGDEVLTTKFPSLISTCAPLLFMTTSTSSIQIGSIRFTCKE